jgi:1,4-alpha-glucan branching enzyme
MSSPTTPPTLMIVLHGHLPWVHHPEYERFLEEDWFFEAVADTWLPLLEVLDGWERDEVDAQLTLGLSPPLLAMMRTPRLIERATRYLDARRRLAGRYLDRLPGEDPFRPATEHSFAEAERRVAQMRHMDGDLPSAFARHWNEGRIELMTCGATHGLLPVLLDEGSAHAQVAEAVRQHEEILGHAPRGIWQPECGVVPTTFDILAEHGLVYSFAEDRALLFGSPPPRWGVHRPVFTPEGVALFSRDGGCGKAVWSADEGYPGDGRYREFYRDLGWDAEDELLDDDHVQGTGDRKNTGVKLHRVTGRVSLDDKEPYDPQAAARALAGHAAHFVDQRIIDTMRLTPKLEGAPNFVAAFDAELFGHWWYEGPRFLDLVARGCAARAEYDPHSPRPVSAWRYLSDNPTHQVQEPAVSSWGDGGAFTVWVNSDNDHLWREIHDARARLGDAVRRGSKSSLEGRALAQATRELMLAQSSDWPFILTMGTQMGYAGRRTAVHLSRAHRLLDQLERGAVDEPDLRQLEERDAVFSEVDPAPFGRRA